MLTEAQQELRRQGIGGSEIASILGLSPYATPLDVYLSKVEGWRKEETVDMERGSFLEDGELRWYAKRKGVVVEIEPTRTLVWGLAVATPDGLALVSSKKRVVEAKCPRRSTGWEDGVPEGYVLQTHWTHRVVSETYGAAAVDSTSHVIALLDGDLRIFNVEADRELQDELLTFAETWWKKHVVARVPPPLGGDDEARAWILRRFPKDVNPIRPATHWEDVRMLELKHAEHEAEKWNGEVETIRNELRESIGEAGGIESPAGRCTWKTNKKGIRSFRTTWESTQ